MGMTDGVGPVVVFLLVIGIVILIIIVVVVVVLRKRRGLFLFFVVIITYTCVAACSYTCIMFQSEVNCCTTVCNCFIA